MSVKNNRLYRFFYNIRYNLLFIFCIFAAVFHTLEVKKK